MGKETWTDLEGNDWKKSVKKKKREVLTFKMMIIVRGNKILLLFQGEEIYSIRA